MWQSGLLSDKLGISEHRTICIKKQEMMIISWNITRECNLKCKHCYRDAGTKDKNELSFEEGKRLLEDITLAGFKTVVLSGGEPLLRKDIFDIVRYAKQQGLRPVLGSNGTLITTEIAEKLKEAGLARAGISLDSIDPRIHDSFRGVKGAFKKTIAGIEALKKVNLEFQIHTTVTRYNYRQVDELIDYAIELKAAAYHIFFLVPAGRGKKETEELISPRDYYRLLNRILERQKSLNLELKPVCAPQFIPLAQQKGMTVRFKKGCLAGVNYCCILPAGDVHPCPYLPIKAGNVRAQRFNVIWQESALFRKLRTSNYWGKCGSCGYKDTCGGCRARAYFSSGNYMGEDDYCVL